MTDLDKLREQILTEFKQVHKLAPADYTENCTNVVMSLLTHTLQTYKYEILDGLPEKRVKVQDIDGDPDEGGMPFCATCGQYNDGDTTPERCYCDNYNQAIDEITAHINSVSEKRGI